MNKDQNTGFKILGVTVLITSPFFTAEAGPIVNRGGVDSSRQTTAILQHLNVTTSAIPADQKESLGEIITPIAISGTSYACYKLAFIPEEKITEKLTEKFPFLTEGTPSKIASTWNKSVRFFHFDKLFAFVTAFEFLDDISRLLFHQSSRPDLQSGTIEGVSRALGVGAPLPSTGGVALGSVSAADLRPLYQRDWIWGCAGGLGAVVGCAYLTKIGWLRKVPGSRRKRRRA